MDTAKELQVLREELIREIDEKIGQMLKKLQNENNTNHQKNHVQTRVYESVYPLNVGTGIYKGKRPTAVIFPGEVRKECPTWKDVYKRQLLSPSYPGTDCRLSASCGKIWAPYHSGQRDVYKRQAPGTDGRHQIEAKRSGFDLERRSKGAAE